MKVYDRIRDSADGYQRTHRWAAFPYAVFKKFGDDRGGQLAALVAYYGFFSLFPLLLVLVTVLGIVLRGDPEAQSRVLGSALSQFPIIGDQIRENISGLSGGVVAIVIGLAGALWGGLGGVKAAQNAMDRIWDVPIKRQPPLLSVLLRGLLMLGVLGGFIIVSTILSAVGVGSERAPLILKVVAVIASVVLNLGVFLLAFRILTVKDLSWRDVLPGAAVAAIGWAILQSLGGYIIGTKLKNANEVYGFFGIVIGLLSWLYLAAQLTLLSAEVNVVRVRNLWPRGMGRDMTEPDQRALEGYAKVEERRPEENVDVSFEPEQRAG